MEPASPSLVSPLKSGDWLDRRRIGLFAGVLLTVELVFFAFIVAGTHGWIVPLEGPCTTDFVSFYAAGTLADAGTPALVYNQAVHLATEEAITAPGIKYQFFFYPPVYLLICAALAKLPYLVAFVTFAAASLAAYLWVARRILGDMSGAALLALLAFPAVFWNIGLGQNAFLSATLFGGATLFVDRRPVLAGILFGALCYKPHFGLLIPLALIAAGRWRTVVVAGATVASLVIASVALYGVDTWRDYIAASTAAPAMYESGRILFAGFVSPFGAIRLVGGSVHLAYATQALATVVAASLVWAVWRHNLSLPLRAATLAAATLVAVPLALLYDLMLGAVAVCWLMRDEAPAPGWEKTVLALQFLVLVDARNLAEEFHLPLTALSALVLFVLVVRRAFAALGWDIVPFLPAASAR
ncbi:MAG TPA: glycosyltransferase family 87 protein [Stellaceae bacterium]|jgi:hypothetical protein